MGSSRLQSRGADGQRGMALPAEGLMRPVLHARPAARRGTSRVRRDGTLLRERPFLTGEATLSQSLANLGRHPFKNTRFRRPGDRHVRLFGTATRAFSDGVATRPGDVVEIEAAPFTRPPRNPPVAAPSVDTVVRGL